MTHDLPMRAISVPNDRAWATIHAGYRVAPVTAAGPVLLHTASRSAHDPELHAAIARLSPGGPRILPAGALVGIVLVVSGIVSAWPLPPVHHLGSAHLFAVDHAAMGKHRSAYEAAWREMSLNLKAMLCRYCGEPCAASCLLSGPCC